MVNSNTNYVQNRLKTPQHRIRSEYDLSPPRLTPERGILSTVGTVGTKGGNVPEVSHTWVPISALFFSNHQERYKSVLRRPDETELHGRPVR